MTDVAPEEGIQCRDSGRPRSFAYSMAAVGEYFGVHYMTVSRAVRRFETRSE